MDAHSFTAGADYRIHAATLTGFSGGSADMLRDVVASDSSMWLEEEDCGGTSGSRSKIAGTVLPTTGTHYVRVRQFNTTSLSGTIHSYHFYLRVLSGSPIPEKEPDNDGPPQAPRSNGWGSRVIGPATAKNDSFAITVNGSDAIGVIAGVDLERGAPVWKLIAGTGVFTGSFIITL
jgi:hypothetical protein